MSCKNLPRRNSHAIKGHKRTTSPLRPHSVYIVHTYPIVCIHTSRGHLLNLDPMQWRWRSILTCSSAQSTPNLHLSLSLTLSPSPSIACIQPSCFFPTISCDGLRLITAAILCPLGAGCPFRFSAHRAGRSRNTGRQATEQKSQWSSPKKFEGSVMRHLAIFINMWSNVDQAPLKSKTEQQTQLLQAAQVCLAWWFQTQRTGLPVFASFFRFMPAEGLWNKPGWCNTLDLLVGAPHWKWIWIIMNLLGWTSHIWNHQHLKFEIDDGDQTRHCGVECFRMEQRQSQSLESVAQNVRVRNPIGQSQSPLNTSTGCRETMNGRQKVSNKESVTPESRKEDQGIMGKSKVNKKQSLKKPLNRP